MERALYFTNYRNIGFGKSERIVLNHSLEKGKMGDLVVVIGANNSGKSNVLDAICAFGKSAFVEGDVTTLSYEEAYRAPMLSLSCKNDSEDYSSKLIYITGKSFAWEYIYPNVQPTAIQNRKELTQVLTYLKSHWNPSGYYCHDGVQSHCGELLQKIDSCSLKELQTQADELIEKMNNATDKKDKVKELKSQFKNSEFVKRLDKNNAKKHLETQYKAKYGIGFFPTVLRYEDQSIKNAQLSCNQSDLEKSTFLLTVFKKIGVQVTQIKNTYDAFRKYNNKGALTTLEENINKKLNTLAVDFNKLYFAEKERYRFKISLESNSIYFSLFRGEKDIILDQQSTGFRWFFNLYFNLLCKNELQPGDIIVMDQPGMDLHIKGREELRRFLKEFARRNDLTIVIATHEPSMIDLDCLDEIRVVSMKDNQSSICNDFAAIDPDDPDCLKPIKEALTVENRILFDPDMNLVFVEGITDYNYLLTFKKLLGFKNLSFLPIKGVGNVKNANIEETQKAISRELIRLKKHDPILLVDSDKAGQSMKKINGQDSCLRVCTLADVDPAFKTIESLFDPEDLKKLGLVDEKGKYVKHASDSAVFKNHIESYEFSETTKENFKKVLQHLDD